MIVTALPIAADHPAYAGHFPGTPVLPGVVLLDATIDALEKAGKGSAGYWEVSNAKFQSAVRPGEALTLHHETLPNGSVRFVIRTSDRAIANGLIIPSSAPSSNDRG
jgi:3-hydroxymyristoyl/3-hydroxydecanoyl-(acyl carrier protein) dehydratase